MKKLLSLLTITVLLVALLASCQPLPEEPPHEHTWKDVAEEPATCTTGGHTAYKECVECGAKKSYTETLPLGHDLVDAECADEHHIKTCSRCNLGISDSTVLVAKASDWKHVNGNDVVYHECETCHENLLATAEVGSVGPTGGRIFYVNENADTDGWKYLEAAPSLLYKGPTAETRANPTIYVDVPGEAEEFKALYGYYKVDGVKTAALPDATLSANIGMGKTNTETLYEKVCKNGAEKVDEDKHYYAAYLCTVLEFTAANGVKYDDWFLPSTAELKKYHVNICQAGIDTSVLPASNSPSMGVMSSTEKNGAAAENFSAWSINPAGQESKTAQKAKSTLLRVLAVRRFM